MNQRVTTVEVDGIEWLERTYEAAREAGLVEMVNQAVKLYRLGAAGSVSYGRVVQTAPVDGIRAVVGGVTGLVIGFARPETAPSAAPEPEPAPKAGSRRTKPTKARSRGPRDYAELEEWLGEAGYTVGRQPAGGYRPVHAPDGSLVTTLPSTPGDHRSLANTVADLRQRTGLRLRKAHR